MDNAQDSSTESWMAKSLSNRLESAVNSVRFIEGTFQALIIDRLKLLM